jgi:hypothetical protein
MTIYLVVVCNDAPFFFVEIPLITDLLYCFEPERCVCS